MSEVKLDLHHFYKLGVLGQLNETMDVSRDLGLTDPFASSSAAVRHEVKIRYRKAKQDCRCGSAQCSEKYGLVLNFPDDELSAVKKMVRSLMERYPELDFKVKQIRTESTAWLLGTESQAKVDTELADAGV